MNAPLNLLCMGLIPAPGALDHPDHRLTALVDVDVLHRDLLLAFAAVAIERIEQSRIGAGEFVGLAQILAPSLERLFAKHGAPIAFHRSVMGGDKLCRDHAFEFIPGLMPFRYSSSRKRWTSHMAATR